MSDEEVDRYVKFLKEACPDIPVFLSSAKEKIGLEQVADYVLTAESRVNITDIGYGGPEFVALRRVCHGSTEMYLSQQKTAKHLTEMN